VSKSVPKFTKELVSVNHADGPGEWRYRQYYAHSNLNIPD